MILGRNQGLCDSGKRGKIPICWNLCWNFKVFSQNNEILFPYLKTYKNTRTLCVVTVAVCFLVDPRKIIWIFYVSVMTWNLPSLSLQFTSAMTAGLCDHTQLYSAVITARPHTCQSMTSTVELYSQLPENQKLACNYIDVQIKKWVLAMVFMWNKQ